MFHTPRELATHPNISIIALIPLLSCKIKVKGEMVGESTLLDAEVTQDKYCTHTILELCAIFPSTYTIVLHVQISHKKLLKANAWSAKVL